MSFINPYRFKPAVSSSVPVYLGGVSTSLAAFVTNRTVTYPAGIQNNDVGILHVWLTDSAGSAQINTPSGWTKFQEHTLTSDMTDAVFWKRLDGTETGDLTVTFTESTGNGVAAAALAIYRGCVATGDPYEAAAKNSQASTTTHVGSAITTLGSNRLVISLFGCYNSNATGTPSTGWIEDWEVITTSGNHGAINGNSIAVADAGSVAAISRSMSASCANTSLTFALVPA